MKDRTPHMERWRPEKNEFFISKLVELDGQSIQLTSSHKQYPGGLCAIPEKSWIAEYPQLDASFYSKLQHYKDMTYKEAVGELRKLHWAAKLFKLDDADRTTFFASLHNRVKSFTPEHYPILPRGLRRSTDLEDIKGVQAFLKQMLAQGIPEAFHREATECGEQLDRIREEQNEEQIMALSQLQEWMKSIVSFVSGVSWLTTRTEIHVESGRGCWFDDAFDTKHEAPNCIVKLLVGDVKAWEIIQLIACACSYHGWNRETKILETRLAAFIHGKKPFTDLEVDIIQIIFRPEGPLEYATLLRETFHFGKPEGIVGFQQLLYWIGIRNKGRIVIQGDLLLDPDVWRYKNPRTGRASRCAYQKAYLGFL